MNPIATVGGVAVTCPSSFQWKLEDICASDSGRTLDTAMQKRRIGQIVSIDLEWHNITTAQASAILKAFNMEYIDVSYLDPKTGGFRTSTFYVGDRSAPLYNSNMDLWTNVSFTLTERAGR